MKIRRIAAAVLAVTSLVGGLTACGNSSSADSGTTVKVGVVGDSNEVWDQVVIPNLKKEGINVELVKFSDYIQPNEALAAVGETVLNPISLYSDKAKKVEDIPEGSEVTIANDSVNAARGLLLLQSAGLIKLDYKEGTNPTPDDIVSNPKNLKITELEASQTARSLPDVGASVINVFMALDAGLNPKSDAIYIEPVNEQSKPYYNIIVSRAKDKDNATYKKIVDAYRSDDVKKLIDKLYKGAVIPLW